MSRAPFPPQVVLEPPVGIRRACFSVAIFLLWFAAVFDPVGNLLHLRYVALAATLVCLTVDFGLRPPLHIRLDLRACTIFYLAAAMPLHGLLLYLLRAGGGEFVDTSYIAAGLLVLTALLYQDERLCNVGVASLRTALWLLTATIIVVYLLIFLEADAGVASVFTESNVALISTREYGGLTLPYIYFLASPMLIYLIGYQMDRLFSHPTLFSLLATAAPIFAFGLSGTRAHMLIAGLYAPVYYLLSVDNKRPRTLALLAITMALAGAYFGIEVLSDFFSTKEDSNELKLQLLDMYREAFADPIVFLFGQGYNAHTWFGPLRDRLVGIEGASKTELTYLELIRVYGLAGASVFFLLASEIARRLSKMKGYQRWWYPAYLIFMVNAGLNPYLFSTNGMLPLALILGIIVLPRRPEELATTPALRAN